MLVVKERLRTPRAEGGDGPVEEARATASRRPVQERQPGDDSAGGAEDRDFGVPLGPPVSKDRPRLVLLAVPRSLAVENHVRGCEHDPTPPVAAPFGQVAGRVHVDDPAPLRVPEDLSRRAEPARMKNRGRVGFTERLIDRSQIGQVDRFERGRSPIAARAAAPGDDVPSRFLEWFR